MSKESKEKTTGKEVLKKLVLYDNDGEELNVEKYIEESIREDSKRLLYNIYRKAYYK